MFLGANFIITPTSKNTPQAIAVCRRLGELLGFARITELTPEAHDEMIAFLSQLTHCIAVTLMTCNDSPSLEEYTGDSFRDLTRIAKINDEMWSEL
ncbi:MAG: prephenate dehydrogenase/arogenate dehydrogenase family protein, partial [Clostridia bacterium]|nr:prephenate dehydrogenase/arogenate dehydrogenase family protein [Clostridia bacterium]